MSITLKHGNIFQENVEAIVNPTNCVGIMGAGLALQFKKKFPENFKMYEMMCNHGCIHPYRLFVFETNQENPKYIINFPTKIHWKEKSKMDMIESNLKNLVNEIEYRKIRSIAIPKIGCGLGGLDWNIVLQKIKNELTCLENVDIIVLV